MHPYRRYQWEIFPVSFFMQKFHLCNQLTWISLNLGCKIALIRFRMYHRWYLLWSLAMQFGQVLIQFAYPPTWKTAAVSLPFLCSVLHSLSRGEVISTMGTMSELIGRHRPPFLPFLVFPSDKGPDENKKCWNGPTSRGINQQELPNICSATVKKYKGLQRLKKRLLAGTHWGHEWSRWGLT